MNYLALCILILFAQEAAAASVVFEDDFRGVQVDGRLYPDPAHWAFTFWPGTQNPESYGDGTNWLGSNGECQAYVTPLADYGVPAKLRYDPFSIKPDGLHIRASVLSAAQQTAYHVGGFRRFGSGMLLSRATFKYGTIRVVAKLPSARGSWPALWLLPQSHQWPPEIDIFEGMAWGAHRGKIHSGLLARDKSFGQWFETGVDLTKDFHEYGLNWNKNRVTALFDGHVLWQMSTPASMHQKMVLIVNLAVGGKWPFNELHVPPVDGMSDARLAAGADLIENDYPAEMVIQSIRIASP